MLSLPISIDSYKEIAERYNLKMSVKLSAMCKHNTGSSLELGDLFMLEWVIGQR